MFPLKKKFTATSKCVNQLKQGTLTEPLVFDLSYNLKVENIFGTRKHYSVHKWKKPKTTNILTSLTSNSHSCKHSKQRAITQTDTVHWPANALWRNIRRTSQKVNTSFMRYSRDFKTVLLLPMLPRWNLSVILWHTH